MSEHAVMAIIKTFQTNYLGGQKILGFAVLDEEKRIMVASSFDHNYGQKMTNPIRSWIIWDHPVFGVKAFQPKHEDDFKNFVAKQFLEASA